jgi:hypothetical protein
VSISVAARVSGDASAPARTLLTPLHLEHRVLMSLHFVSELPLARCELLRYGLGLLLHLRNAGA